MLTENEKILWQEQGVLGPYIALSVEEMTILKNYLYFNIIEPVQYKKNELYNWHLLSKSVFQLAANNLILEKIKDLLGPDIMLWRSSFFVKQPQEVSAEVHWHQDDVFWKINSEPTVCAWLALDEIHQENGCVQMMSGSHSKKIPYIESQNSYFPLQADPAALDKNAKILQMECKPGEFFIFNQKVLHRSGINKGTSPRAGLSLRYATPQFFSEAPKPACIMLAGTDKAHLNHFFKAPEKL